MEQQRKAASMVLTGTIITYSVGIFCGILIGIWFLAGGYDSIREVIDSAVNDGDIEGMSATLSIIQSSLVIILIGIISTLGQLSGAILCYLGMKNLGAGLDEVGQRGARNLTMGALFTLIGICVGLLNWVVAISAVLAGICSVVGAVLIMIGANTLSKSESLSELGQRGARCVYLSYLYAIIAIAAIIIPIIGWLAMPVLMILSVIKNLEGWYKLKNSFKVTNLEN